MLHILLSFLFFSFLTAAQIVDEADLIAKPKNKKIQTQKQPLKSNKNDSAYPAKPLNNTNLKTVPQKQPLKTPQKQFTKQQIKPPAIATPQQPPLANTPQPVKIAEPKLKLSPTTEKKESIPPLSEEDLNTPINTNKTEETKEPSISSENNTSSTNLTNDLDRPKYKNRKAWTVDYNTWYEMLIIKDKTASTYSESKSHYFGVGFYYDYTVYEEKYGYAGSLGFIAGNAQAGTINTGEYYERRISWLGYRAGGRLFVRANNRIDIGPALIIQYKNTNWPEETNYKVMSQANPQYFMYLDTRWRISYPLELIQSFGFHTRQYALVWRLGINYTFN